MAQKSSMARNIHFRNVLLVLLATVLLIAVPVSALVIAGNATNGVAINQTPGNASSALVNTVAPPIPAVTSPVPAATTAAPATANTPLSPVTVVAGVGIAALAVAMRFRR